MLLSEKKRSDRRFLFCFSLTTMGVHGLYSWAVGSQRRVRVLGEISVSQKNILQMAVSLLECSRIVNNMTSSIHVWRSCSWWEHLHSAFCWFWNSPIQFVLQTECSCWEHQGHTVNWGSDIWIRKFSKLRISLFLKSLICLLVEFNYYWN